MRSERKQYAVEVSKLTHSYAGSAHKQQTLNNLSLSISAGKITCLLGQSGSGKTTLLNLIAGLEPVQSGSILVDGVAVHSLDETQRTLFRRESIGMVFQSFNLLPTLTVFDNVSVPLALNQTPAAQRQARVDEILDAVALSSKSQSYPDQLSGGEQQRVAIARAIVHQPAIILADEPTGSLDSSNGQRVMELFTRLTQSAAITLVLVTHSHEIAARADDVFILSDGTFKSAAENEAASDEYTAW